MISFVAKLINVFATTLQNILSLTSCTGKIIVTVVTWVTTSLMNILQNIILFFQILYEDNKSIFTEELPNSANSLFDTAFDQFSLVQNTVLDIYVGIYLQFNAFIALVKWLVLAVVLIITEVFKLLLKTVLFTGDTVWLIVTFIPVYLPHILRVMFMHIGSAIANIAVLSYMRLLKFTNFLTEIPLQSFMGITSAILIVRLSIHFREAITLQLNVLYWAIIRKLLYLHYIVFNYFTSSEDALIAELSGRIQIEEARNSSPALVDEGTDALCVICQERQKCVLTLPCRHICLCTDCCRRLYGYQRTCPICRTFINHSVTVYL